MNYYSNVRLFKGFAYCFDRFPQPFMLWIKLITDMPELVHLAPGLLERYGQDFYRKTAKKLILLYSLRSFLAYFENVHYRPSQGRRNLFYYVFTGSDFGEP